MKQEIQNLVNKYLHNHCTAEEVLVLLEYFRKDSEKALVKYIVNHFEFERSNDFGNEPNQKILDRVYQKLILKIEGDNQPQLVIKSNKLWIKIISSATIFIIIFGGIVLFSRYHFNQESSKRKIDVGDAKPAQHSATLTLANGKKLKLSESLKGNLATEAGIAISNTTDGQILYSIKPVMERNSVQTDLYNTLSTEKGETYQLQLPDGTKVWLNAASSLSYALSINRLGQRRVKLKGEGYFEVTKDRKHDFIVETDKQTIQVIGTHFNVSSYTDEAAETTTLLEGRVKISSNQKAAHSKILKPGEQSILSGMEITVNIVDTDESIAWKNGYFVFDYEKLENIMRKVSRWYNLEVVYQNSKVKDLTYVGTVSRFENVSKVLKKLEQTGNVSFKMSGNRIFVNIK